ncbi:MAG: hypothetical protein IKK07_06375 [Bacteroides sp.]|nr:hypothetical protein [Bacteroides sp.]
MMKQLFFIALAFILASCSSEVEKYIENEFSTQVRIDNLSEELINECIRFEGVMNEFKAEALKNHLPKYDSLLNRYNYLRKDIDNRYRAMRYGTIVEYVMQHGYVVMDEYERERDRTKRNANELEKIIKPYLNYTDQKMVEFRTSVVSFADSVVDFSSFEQNPGITDRAILDTMLGNLTDTKNVSKDVVDSLAKDFVANYFASHPTPDISSYEYQKEDDRWYIRFTNSKKYYLKAIKNMDGGYDYEYELTDNSL